MHQHNICLQQEVRKKISAKLSCIWSKNSSRDKLAYKIIYKKCPIFNKYIFSILIKKVLNVARRQHR